MKLCLLFISLLLVASLGTAEETGPLFKDQKQSATKWGEVNFNTFLSFSDWREQRDERDQVPEWETIVKERNNREIVGRFFQCVGNCRIDRGQSFFNPSFKTSIYEGDEIQTVGDSYAWIFLFDGTMVRLSPESSVTFNELNIGIKENFISARVNVGDVLWLSRNESTLEENNIRETEVLFNPLALYEAQPIPDKKKYVEGDLIELVEEKETVLKQYKNLNNLIVENNKLTRGKPTYAFIVMPNVTVMGYNPTVELVSILGGKSYLKKRSPTFLGLKKDATAAAAEEDVFVQMRGFENKDLTPIEADKWLAVDEKGRGLTTEEENLHWLTMGEFITKRIPSMLVARELLMQKYSEFCFREKYDPNILAANDGYRLWGSLKSSENKDQKKSDLELRLDFLKEYFRRIETTNLLVSTHFRDRLKERGESMKAMEYGNYFFIKALDKYYSYSDYTDEKETGEVLNSTTKLLWKRMHGIR